MTFSLGFLCVLQSKYFCSCVFFQIISYAKVPEVESLHLISEKSISFVVYELLAQIPFSSLTIYLFVYLLSRVIQRSSVLGTLHNIHFDLRKILYLCHCNLWKCRLLPLFPSHFRLPFIARLFQPACKTQTQELRLQVYKLSSSKKISRHALTIKRSGSELEFRKKAFSV